MVLYNEVVLIAVVIGIILVFVFWPAKCLKLVKLEIIEHSRKNENVQKFRKLDVGQLKISAFEFLLETVYSTRTDVSKQRLVKERRVITFVKNPHTSRFYSCVAVS